jgi:hypothetical protein
MRHLEITPLAEDLTGTLRVETLGLAVRTDDCAFGADDAARVGLKVKFLPFYAPDN